MTDLRELVSQLGAENVTTHVQSDNVLSRSAGSRAGLARTIQNELRRGLGLDLRVRA